VIEWVERIRDKGINAPLRIGVPGPASVKTLLRFASRCGVAASTRVMAKYGLSIGKLLTTTGPDVFVTELANNLKPRIHGAVSLHFYPFGGLRGTAEWIRQFSKKNL
jgi:methylenetetrahydrofolate reductase (NADPH)